MRNLTDRFLQWFGFSIVRCTLCGRRLKTRKHPAEILAEAYKISGIKGRERIICHRHRF